MTPCPRHGCGGSVGVFAWHDTCSLCARGLTAARPPTAKEAGDKRLEKPNVTDYYSRRLRRRLPEQQGGLATAHQIHS